MSTAPAPALLTYADVVARIEAVASGREDYVNAVRSPYNDEWETCQNLTDDGQPSCIVGTAFFTEAVAAGLTPDQPANRQGVGVLLEDYLYPHGLTVTLRALRFLETVQSKQDTGMTWGAAIADAKAAIEDGPDLQDEAATPRPAHD